MHIFDIHLRSTGVDTTRGGGTTGGNTTPDTVEVPSKVETEVESNHSSHCMAIDVHVTDVHN